MRILFFAIFAIWTALLSCEKNPNRSPISKTNDSRRERKQEAGSIAENYSTGTRDDFVSLSNAELESKGLKKDDMKSIAKMGGRGGDSVVLERIINLPIGSERVELIGIFLYNLQNKDSILSSMKMISSGEFYPTELQEFANKVSIALVRLNAEDLNALSNEMSLWDIHLKKSVALEMGLRGSDGPHPPEHFKEELVNSYHRGYWSKAVQNDPFSAANSLLNNEVPENQIREIGMKIAHAIVNRASEKEAFAFIDKFSDPKKTTQISWNLAYGWAKKDPIAASEFVSKMPPSSNRNYAAQGIADYLKTKGDTQNEAEWRKFSKKK